MEDECRQYILNGLDVPTTGHVQYLHHALTTGSERQRVAIARAIAKRSGNWCSRRWHTSLADAYRTEARVVIWKEDDALKAPASALFRRQDNRTAFVYQDKRAELRFGEAGKRNTFEVQVLGGLQQGENVILHPSNDINNGSRLRARSTR